MNVQKTIREFAIISVGTAIVAAAVFFFMLPSHVSVGSGAALAIFRYNEAIEKSLTIELPKQ